MPKKYGQSIFHLIIISVLFSQSAILDDYINNIDPYTDYSEESSEFGVGYTSYILDLTSQKWLTENEVNRPIWQHWITIFVPWDVDYETAFMLINGGSNSYNPPDPNDELNIAIGLMAVETKSVMAILDNIPNEPLIFTDEGFERTEDEIIAYTWEKYLSTGDPKWPLNIPMTKGAVTAMDAIQEFCADIPFFPVTIDDFFVSGGSKRGWTTFLTAAVDDRVMAIAPIVFDALNLVQSFRLHWGSYGEWSPAVHDYEDMGIFNYFTEPIIQDLMQIVDPYAYRDRLNMPKYMIAATGDEFFVPAAQNYVPGLPGEKYMAYFPNTGHGFSEEETNLLQNLFVFYQAALENTELPEYSWARQDDGSLVVECETQPSEVILWQAVNPTARDFRDYVVGDPWESSPLTDQGGDVYIAQAVLPEEGWKGLFVELEFDLGYDYPFKVTTEVSIIPDDLPYATDVTLNVLDGSQAYIGFQVVGSLTSWDPIQLHDDGEGVDEIPGDHHWTVNIPAVADGEYFWQVFGIDSAGMATLISENLTVTISGDTISGDVTFSTSIDGETGDVNGDGIINILDVILAVNVVLASEYNENADMNGDGINNILDIIILVNIILTN